MNGLLEQLAQVSGLAEGFIWQAAMVFVRVGAVVALMPAIGEQMVPVRVRLAVALGFTMVVLPAVSATAAPDPGLLLPLVNEAVAGLSLGVCLRLLVVGLQTAGMIAAQSTSLSQMFAGTGPDPQPVIANLLVLAALAVFVSMDGIAKAVGLVILSYELFPAGQAISAAELAEWDLARVTHAFSLAFSLAAPFVLAALLYNLALGAINRAMPQLMVSFVGAPAISLGGIALLALSAPLLMSAWREEMQLILLQPFGG